MSKTYRFFGLTLALALISACGQDVLTPSYLFDVYQSPAGQDVRRAEAECAAIGLRFTPENEIDSSTENQAALERPFLTHSGKMKTLEKYILAAHEVQKVFGGKAPIELEPRSKAALLKSGDLARRILDGDKHGRGGIVVNEAELSLFTKMSLALAAQEDDLANAGVSFQLTISATPVHADVKKPLDTAKAKAFVSSSQAFVDRFGHDLASPVIRLKKEALEKALGNPAP